VLVANPNKKSKKNLKMNFEKGLFFLLFLLPAILSPDVITKYLYKNL